MVGTTATFIRERPLPAPARHYGRGARRTTRTATVTNEDYAGMLCEFANGARGTFEASRAIVGPESQMAFDVYGTERRASGWNFEALNELRVYRADGRPRHGLHDRARRRPLPATTAQFVPGSANGIGFEDLVVIEDYEFCRAVAEERPFAPGFDDALAWVAVQAALLRSARSRAAGRTSCRCGTGRRTACGSA